jgi:hypothetical protein
MRTTLCPFASVEHYQAQRMVIGQQHPQLGGTEEVGGSGAVLQRDHALIGVGMKPTMADEVQDVPGTREQCLLQILPGMTLQPGHLCQPLSLKLCQRRVDALLFAGHIQLR